MPGKILGWSSEWIRESKPASVRMTWDELLGRLLKDDLVRFPEDLDGFRGGKDLFYKDQRLVKING